nr:hypothetical protein [uncultured Rhodopila sp.]
MRAELNQPPVLQPGFALVTIREAPELDPGSLTFSVESPSRGFLQELSDTPWGTTHAWLTPASAIAGADGLELTMGPECTWFLQPNVTYVLRLRDAGRSDPLKLRMAWKAIRMPSQPPRALPKLSPGQTVTEEAPLQPTRADADITESTVVPRPAILEPIKTDIEPTPVAGRGNRPALIGLVALVLVLAAGGAAWFMLRPKDTPPPAAPTPAPQAEGPLGAASARAFVQTTTGSQETYAEAQRYLKNGSPEALQGALILLNRAADGGSGPAQTAIGEMYDPDTFGPQTSAMKAPDTDKALLWYSRAAKSNDPEGLYRLGKLLMSGRASAPGLGPEQGVADLQRAAELGSKPAQAEIDKLRAKPN